MLKCTTRHVHIFAGEVTADNRFIPRDDLLTLDVDPDNELVWNDAALQKVYARFEELVEEYRGRDLTEYNLRRIGSELEHFIRSLLKQGEIAYNLQGRTPNYSMGFPQIPAEAIVGQYIPKG